MNPRWRPTFVVGAGRSGTTLITNVLGLHSALEPVYETGFVAGLLEMLRAFPILSEAERRRELEAYCIELARWGRSLPDRHTSSTLLPKLPFGKANVRFTAAELSEAGAQLAKDLIARRTLSGLYDAARQMLERLFLQQAARGGKTAWVNKTPLYVEYLDDLDLVFKNPIYVHVVRDGRDVVASLLKQGWGLASWEAAARRWLRQVEAGLAYEARRPEHVVRISLESFLADPEGQTRLMLTRVGLEDETDQILETFAQHAELVGPEQRSDWTRELSRSTATALEQLLAPRLVELGYPVHTQRKGRVTSEFSLERGRTLVRLANRDRVPSRKVVDTIESAAHGKGSGDEQSGGGASAEIAEFRRKARLYTALEPELPTLRSKAARFDALDREVAGLRKQARAADELAALKNELREHQRKAKQLEAIMAELPNLRRKARLYTALEPELPTLRSKAARFDALDREVAGLRARVGALETAEEVGRALLSSERAHRAT